MSGKEYQGSMSDQDVLALEEHQLKLFLTDVRPVGEEKSELFPEPQYFSLGFMGGAVELPHAAGVIVDKCGSAAAYGAGLRRILAPTSAVHLSGILFMATWGREMMLLEPGMPGKGDGVVFDDGDLRLTDKQVADVMRFALTVKQHYRDDGRAYPADDQALGSHYRILPAAEAQAVAARTTPLSQDEASDILGLLATVRAVSFLMEAETREALMVHGPYPCDEPGHQLVVFECSDLHWSLFPNFPLPGGVRWTLPDEPFPVASLAIAMVLKDVTVRADRFGTLYIDPMGPEQVVSASLLTRGADFFDREELSEIPVSEAKSLRRKCDDIQDFMFLQVAGWDANQRLWAGVMDEQMWFIRLLAGAGFSRAELERHQQEMFRKFSQVTANCADSIASRTTDQLPFFVKLNAFIAGDRKRLFTPFA